MKVKGPGGCPLLVAQELQTHFGQIATFNLNRDRIAMLAASHVYGYTVSFQEHLLWVQPTTVEEGNW